MTNWLLIVSLVLHISPVWWGLHLLTFWCPVTTGFYVSYFYFNSKASCHIASIFDMLMNINGRVDVNQDGPSLIIEAPPPPRAPKYPKMFNVFTHGKCIIHCFFFLLYLSCYVSVMRSSCYFGFKIRFTGHPKNYPNKCSYFDFNSIRLLQYFTYWEDSFGVKSILKCSWGLEAYIYNVYAFCWPMHTDLRRLGDTFAVAGDRAI